MAALDASFWAGKRVLLTGHTGFKGSWAAIWLTRMGAKVVGLALPPDQTPALFDLARIDRDELRELVVEAWLTRAQKRVAKAWLAENAEAET